MGLTLSLIAGLLTKIAGLLEGSEYAFEQACFVFVTTYFIYQMSEKEFKSDSTKQG